jgi:hypothetical protein
MIGVKYKIDNALYLQDLKLAYAELAYYEKSNTIPLNILIRYDGNNIWHTTIYIQGRLIKRYYGNNY